MTAIDKAAIAWTIAIVVVGVGFAAVGLQPNSSAPQVMDRETSMVPKVSEPMEKMEKSMESQKELIEPKATEPKVMEKPKVVPEPKVMTGPQTVKISIPKGSSVPGCEETNACYLPPSISIKVGDTIVWSNDDTAAHTVTSGSATNGPSGVFDSSLLIAGGTFEHKLTASGTVDYYCMVHPWMTGKIQVS